MGYGSHAILFGPQFASFHGAAEWRHTLSSVRTAVARSDACLGRATPLLFRSPAFNFDPLNTPQQQAQFGQLMRPLVEEQVGKLTPAVHAPVMPRGPHVQFAHHRKGVPPSAPGHRAHAPR